MVANFRRLSCAGDILVRRAGGRGRRALQIHVNSTFSRIENPRPRPGSDLLTSTQRIPGLRGLFI